MCVRERVRMCVCSRRLLVTPSGVPFNHAAYKHTAHRLATCSIMQKLIKVHTFELGSVTEQNTAHFTACTFIFSKYLQLNPHLYYIHTYALERHNTSLHTYCMYKHAHIVSRGSCEHGTGKSPTSPCSTSGGSLLMPRGVNACCVHLSCGW